MKTYDTVTEALKDLKLRGFTTDFNIAFDKKGLRFKKKGTTLSVKFKEPLQIDYNASNDEIMESIMLAIGQSQTQKENKE